MTGVCSSLFQKHRGALHPPSPQHTPARARARSSPPFFCCRSVLSAISVAWRGGHPSPAPTACSCSGPGPALSTVLHQPARALRCCSSAEGGTPPLLLQPVPVRARARPPPRVSAALRKPPSDPGCTPHSASAPAAGPVKSGRPRPTHKERISSYRCLVTRSRRRVQVRFTAHSGLGAFYRPL
ncbi:hypothetical protein NDU88_006288 [Pleurodeles waltl]|uniref:Uncharacterized protein n=1 Tax=Pleurodeles waltl TaxID=8319 RepID=A0AAV7WDZ8_PLEWA|nr:hypothetical protein NDU88_006288 [Pleurodeles waltl]